MQEGPSDGSEAGSEQLPQTSLPGCTAGSDDKEDGDDDERYLSDQEEEEEESDIDIEEGGVDQPDSTSQGQHQPV